MRACGGTAAWAACLPVRAAMLLACVTLAGCLHFGPGRLDDDQIGYARALSDAQKRQTLLNIVRLRYADTPTFLDATRIPPKARQIAILTRSMLAVLNEIGSQIDVPPRDIASGRTLPTVGDVGIERRPVVIVRSGPAAPADAFAAVRYHGTSFWIADDDFDSKLAFTTVQILLAPATATTTGPGTIIAIPTG